MQIPDQLDQVGAGWWPLLRRLHHELVAVVPGYVLGELVEKFGGVRVYVDTFGKVPQTVLYEARQLITWTELMSMRVCEFCGQPGTLRGGGWKKTVCGTCPWD